MNTKMPIALLLEDEVLIAMDLEVNLEGAGFEVVHLMSCWEAKQWLDGGRPEVAIVDVQLTDGSSHDVAERLRLAGIPFIVHSGDHPSQYAGTPFEHGVWLNKPTASTDLIEAVTRAVGGP